MSNELMKLIEDYAEWSAQSFWEDDQGYTEHVEIARANKEAARKAVVDAVATLQAELDKVQDEINCTEHSLEAFSCEFQAEVFNQGFDCLSDFVHAIWTESNKQRIVLQAENERNAKSANHFHDLFHLTADENTALTAKLVLLEKQIVDAGLWAPIERSKLKVVIKEVSMKMPEPIGCGYVVKWERGDTSSTHASGYAQVLGVNVYDKQAMIDLLEEAAVECERQLETGAHIRCAAAVRKLKETL